MEYGWDFFWAVAASSAGSAALLAVAAYLGRGQLSHWLSKDLELLKSRLAQELETHKNQLIRDTEKIKVASDIKKATALMVAEKRFNAYAAFFQTTTGLGSYFVRGMAESREPDSFKQANDAFTRFYEAYYQATPFLEQDDMVVVMRFISPLSESLPMCRSDSTALDDAQLLQKIKEFSTLERNVERMLLAKLTELETL